MILVIILSLALVVGYFFLQEHLLKKDIQDFKLELDQKYNDLEGVTNV